MTCLKCGKETKDNQVFCRQCLSSMEAYPVKPDVHIHLPNRTFQPTPKRPWYKRSPRSEAEQLVHLRKTVRGLISLVVLLSLLLAITGFILLHQQPMPENDNLGRNYTYENPSK